jgi:hypothetical protein
LEAHLAALERLVVEKGLINRNAMRERKEARTEAYLHTPHDKPVELNGMAEPSQSNDVTFCAGFSEAALSCAL